MTEDTLEAWVVETNTDTTEDKGRQRIVAVCRIEATAQRLARGIGVQGGPGDVTATTLIRVGGSLYGPVNIIDPEPDDLRRQVRIDAKRSALAKARAAGLSEDEIKALQS